MKIAIASGKGGTGKTTLATNLSAFLSESEKVVLADLDVEEPNSGLFLKGDLVLEEVRYKMIPKWNEDTCTLSGKCREVCNFNAIVQLGPRILVLPELCHSCYACSELCPSSSLPMTPQRMGVLKEYKINDNLTFVESRLDIGQEQAVPLIMQTNDFIDLNFDNTTIKLFDSPPGASCPVIEVTKDVDKVILITEPTPFGLHDLIIIVETMRELKKDFGVVINRYGVGNDDVIDYCNREGIDIIAKISNDRHIAELYSGGDLIYDKVPAVRDELERVKSYIFSEGEGM